MPRRRFLDGATEEVGRVGVSVSDSSHIEHWCGPYGGRLKDWGQLKIRPGNGEWVEDQWKFTSSNVLEGRAKQTL